MNNNMNFDPITGQPLNTNNNIESNNLQRISNTQELNHAPQINIQQQFQSIPTVEQSKQEFINMTQTNISEKKEEKKDSPNIIFIIILFLIILAAILFVFPYLLKIL